MHRRTKHPLTTGAAVSLLLLSACSRDRHTSAASPIPPNDDIGVSLTDLPLLAAGCAISSTTMTVTVKDGESAYISLRASDNTVTVNGNIFAAGGASGSGGTGSGGAGGAVADTGRPCEISAAGSTINVVTDNNGMHALGRSVILDYVNGLYLKAASATVAPIKVDFTLTGDNGSKNSLKIRGSDGADSFAIGAGTATATSGAMLNINALGASGSGAAGSGGGGSGGSGASSGLDGFADVTFKNVPTVVISSGANDDRLDASGTTAAGVGAAFPNAVSLFGNDGNDTIIGGLGDDLIVGGLGADILNGCQGNDTYDMGAVPSGADVIAEACAGTMEGSDTLDYSKRTGALTVNLSRTLTATNSMTDSAVSGEMSEGAHISDKVVTIKLGAGDDTITVPMGSTINHKIKGGKGDDTFNGNGAQDTFDGEIGDDTCISATSIMDYSARMNAVTVSVCGSSCGASDANDGDPSAMGSTHAGSASASTTAAGGIPISTLTGTGFTAASVGNTITLSACMTGSGADNGAYPIVEYISATSVKIDTSSVSGFAAETGGCAFSEALPGGTTNTGATATAIAAATTGSVTGITNTTNLLGHTIALTATATSTGGGMSHTNDNGTYYVVKVLNSTSVAIDTVTPVTGGTMYAGSVTAMDWVETGSEHDNVQCANVVGSQGDDTITGDGRNNVLRGGTGNDTINGGSGNDQLYGEAGNDNLYGGPGDDTLVGSDGTDLLVGGDGNDVLEGDAGNDTFTCDGKNVSTATTNGTAPGDSDFRVDYSSGDMLGVTPTDCEF